MNTIKALAIALTFATGMALPVTAFAGTTGSQSEKAKSTAMMKGSQETTVNSVNHFLGKDIIGSNGEKLGRISDIIIDRENGRVAYLVVSSGGMMAKAGEKHVVPFMALKTDTAGRLSLAIEKNRFSKAPTLAKNLDDRKWGAEVYSFYGIAPYWEKSMDPSSHEGTK